MTTVAVRLPAPLANRLEGLARDSDRPKSVIIQKALEAYLEEYADLRIAKKRFNNPADPTIDGKELRKSLGL